MIIEVFAPGMTAMAAPVLSRDARTIGAVTIAGPMFRLTEARMTELGPRLLETAAEIAAASACHCCFDRAPRNPGTSRHCAPT